MEHKAARMTITCLPANIWDTQWAALSMQLNTVWHVYTSRMTLSLETKNVLTYT